MSNDFRTLLQDSQQFILFDGAMGTQLQEKGLKVGDLAVKLNITAPEIVQQVHSAYVEAGADVITANTFEANELKLTGVDEVEQVISAGVDCARAAGAKYVALDIGPLGQLMEPIGPLSFDRAYDIFSRIVKAGAAAGADIVLVETMSDLYECKGAVLAVKENSNLPIIVSLSFQADGHTFVGVDAKTAAITLSALGVDALGANCSVGPADLTSVVDELLKYSTVPVIVQANAGLPQIANGKAVYDISPTDYAKDVLKLAQQGVRLIGGCCGTTPEYIALLREGLSRLSPLIVEPKKVTACTSGSQTVEIGEGLTVIGERINPTGKPLLKSALKTSDYDYVVKEAFAQVEAGAQVLDINVGLPEIDEPKVLVEAIKAAQSAVNVPIQIDSPNPLALEQALRYVNGKAIINSVNGKLESLDTILPLAKKYGAVVIGLTLDESGIPPKAEGRLKIARKILNVANKVGIKKQDLMIDCLTLAASAQQDEVRETLKAIRLVKSELGLKTVLGVSNVSFGLPNRGLLTAVFLQEATKTGLDAAIMDPVQELFLKQEEMDALRVLNGEDVGAENYIAKYSQVTATPDLIQGKQSIKPKMDCRVANAPRNDIASSVIPAVIPAQAGKAGIHFDLLDIIIKGHKSEAAEAVRTLLNTEQPLDIVNNHFVPALDKVGAVFEQGELFLPQLMNSAQTVQNGFEVLKAHLVKSGEKQESRGKILLATVKGDIHDIGKNIVKVILENYGFEVIDLGKDVPVELIVQTIRVQDIKLAGLSALMTTTVESMKETIAAVRAAGLDCKFMVGGAVMNAEYAQMVGADFYTKDAVEGAKVAGEFFGR